MSPYLTNINKNNRKNTIMNEMIVNEEKKIMNKKEEC